MIEMRGGDLQPDKKGPESGSRLQVLTTDQPAASVGDIALNSIRAARSRS
jgi:hypothetical protein